MKRDPIQAVGSGEVPAVLLTVVSIHGSAPRHPGAKMILRSDGSSLGTVGGGQGEYQALKRAKEALETRADGVVKVEMLGAEALGSEMICGGMSTMLVEYIAQPGPYELAATSLAAGRRVLLVKRIPREAADGTRGPSADGPTLIAILGEDGRPIFGEVPAAVAGVLAAGLPKKPTFLEDSGIFLDILYPEEKLLILGGGHVGLAVSRAVADLGFSVTVVDDRSAFADHSRFPREVRTVQRPYLDAIAEFPFDPATYVVIVTPAHMHDLECVRAVLGKETRYTGLIGSARKVSMMREQLLNEGNAPEKVGAVRAPIGLAIGAETPEEIAISIAAQLVEYRRDATPNGKAL